MQKMDSKLQQILDQRQAKGLLRRLPASLAGRADFCSNDYLGFARTILPQATHGGATGSRLISGNSILAEELEQKIAHFHRAEAALLFSSGYAANVGLLQAIVGRNDTIVYDKYAHASIRDGIVLSRAHSLGFAHNDLHDLERKLQVAKGTCFVLVESVYSMDGDIAPLIEMASLCEQYDAALIVDEAHGTGVCGTKGEGLVASLGLQNKVWARIHTFGKAIGSHGAVIAGSTILREYLVNFARSFIYSTALPEHTLLSIQSAYSALQSSNIVEQLNERIDYFLSACSPAVRQRLVLGNSPIQALIWPGNEAVQQLAQQLNQHRLAVLPIRHPTVPRGEERLRICLHTYNTNEEINLLTTVLNASM